MKTHKHLFEQIVSFPNLLSAAYKAAQNKHNKPDVARFFFYLEQELFALQHQLQTHSYVPGKYHTFYVHDPKKRLISAAPFRDRVVHHALCNIIEPIFERSFNADSYANRCGKGTHAAILRCQHYAKQYPYVLKCDIRKFFPSIDHDILKIALRRKIACRQTLWLIDLIIDNSNPQDEHIAYFAADDLFTPFNRRRGLPIGNLTSQFWANVYLNQFDHFVKQQLKAKGYVRYVDDFLLFAESPQILHQCKKRIIHFLSQLRLLLHPNKTHIHATQKGIPFLGFRIFPHYRYVQKCKQHRSRRFLYKKIKQYQSAQLNPNKLEAGLNSWLGHVRFGQSQRIEQQVFNHIRQQGVALYRHPGGSWRVLEQQS